MQFLMNYRLVFNSGFEKLLGNVKNGCVHVCLNNEAFIDVILDIQNERERERPPDITLKSSL